MARPNSDSVLRHLRTVLAAQAAEPLTDADLMRRFVERGDETAFAILVRRHGGLVLKVCRHVLHRAEDADDAFQATFMVLIRKIASIQRQTSLVSWLHRVAFRCAMDVRKRTMRRRKYEQKAIEDRTAECPVLSAALNELQAFLDDEIDRLPEKYRAPFLLCCLEGKSRADAAHALGWNEGTLASRLAKAREILQKRLSARGISLSAALGAMAVSPSALTAGVSQLLFNRTVDGALAYAAGSAAAVVSSQVLTIAQGVLNGMLLTKLKLGILIVFAASLSILATGGLLAQFRDGKEQASKKGVEVSAQIVIIKKPSLNDAMRKNADEELVATSISILGSEALAKRAIDKHKLVELSSLSESADPVQGIVQALSVTRDPKTAANLINLSYMASDAKDGVAILNAVIESFQEFLELKYMVQGQETFALVKKARQALNSDLQDAHAKLAEIQPDTIIVRHESQKKRIWAVAAKMDEVQIKLNEIEGRLEWIESVPKQGNRLPLMLKANEWAARSGYDKLKEKDGDTVKAYAESFNAEREELQFVMRSLEKTLSDTQSSLAQLEKFKLEERNVRNEARRIEKLLEIVEVQ